MPSNSRKRTHSARVTVGCLKLAQAYVESKQRREAPSPQEQRAWDEFFAVCDPVLCRLVRRFGLKWHDREDCVQKSWVKVIQGLPEFHFDPANPRLATWLFMLVRSSVVDLNRAHGRHQVEPLTPELQETLSTRYAHRESSERDAERSRRRAFYRALAKLRRRAPAVSFRVLQMRWFEGYSFGEIAKRLKLRRASVWWRHSRIRSRLRAIYLTELALERRRRDW